MNPEVQRYLRIAINIAEYVASETESTQVDDAIINALKGLLEELDPNATLQSTLPENIIHHIKAQAQTIRE